MKTKKYKAIWRYTSCTKLAGKVYAEAEAYTIEDLARQMMHIYSNCLGDDYSLNVWHSRDELIACYGEADLPAWVAKVTGYPVYEFVSDFGDDGDGVLCNPTPREIVMHMYECESYGDYDLELVGLD